MGIYDRDYAREQQPGLTIRAPQTIVVTLILINLALWLANGLFTHEAGTISNTLAAHGDTITKPWLWWQLLTYGFVHASEPRHILFNMLGLWFLGREIERHLGRGEFLRFYLLTLVIGSIVWSLANLLRFAQPMPNFSVVGASGAIAGVVILFALNFPRRTLLLFFVIPVPAWLVGVLLIVSDVLGAAGSVGKGNVAYSVHLAGAAFAFLYFHFGWNLTRIMRNPFSSLKFRRGPKLRIHDPSQDEGGMSDEVDRILEKIHREGENSLSRKERRILENASREYQKRRHVGKP